MKIDAEAQLLLSENYGIVCVRKTERMGRAENERKDYAIDT